jgi:hypothetical protein
MLLFEAFPHCFPLRRKYDPYRDLSVARGGSTNPDEAVTQTPGEQS